MTTESLPQTLTPPSSSFSSSECNPFYCHLTHTNTLSAFRSFVVVPLFRSSTDAPSPVYDDAGCRKSTFRVLPGCEVSGFVTHIFSTCGENEKNIFLSMMYACGERISLGFRELCVCVCVCEFFPSFFSRIIQPFGTQFQEEF